MEIEMISPIKKKKTKKVVDKNRITEEKFKELIRSIYYTMLEYSRLRSVYLTKNNPMLFGNVEFWFETDANTNQSNLKFNRSVSAWDENKILSDIELYEHSLYYSTEPR
jgi:hypothetical protein